MTIHAALLRAVNLGGFNRISMSDLRDLAGRLGLTNARTLLQSGNLVFESTGRTPAQLERLLEEQTAKRMRVQTEFFVRTSSEWRGILAANPFRREAKKDPGHLLVVFLKAPPSAADVKALQAAIPGREIVRADGRQAYIVYPDGVGRSRLTAALIEKKLGTRGTARNWNTVLRLAELAEPAD